MNTYSDWLLSYIREAKKCFIWDRDDTDRVIEILKFHYHCCVASENLLQEAQLYAYSGDQEALSNYYRDHLNEERDEVGVLVLDLKSAGVDAFELEPDALAMALIGSQYYMVKHVDAACLLGYMAIEEADPTAIEVVEYLEQKHGKDLFKFLRMHAIKDREHGKELVNVIDGLPEEKQRYVTMSVDNVLPYLAKLYGRR